MNNGNKTTKTIKMTKYLSLITLILLVSCKQAKTKNDTIQSSQDVTENVDEKIDYDAIWTEANEKLDAEFSENFDSISDKFEEFIPNGSSIISYSTGDANLDGLLDTVLIVKNDEDEYDSGTLILLIKQNDESYKPLIKASNIFSGDNNNVIIHDGRIFIVENNNAGVIISLYKFDKTKQNWLYIEEFTSGLAGEGEITKATETSILGE